MKFPAKAYFFLFLSFFSIFSLNARAQVAPSAFRSPFSVTVGAVASGFAPDYTTQKLGGVGAYVDVNLFHGFGIEGEGRWLRFHEFEGIHQDNYLIGPRYTVKHIWKAAPYVKALAGYSNMTFENNIATGRFTTLAFGGGVDLRLTRHWSLRALDAEYQIYPSFLGGTLSPYGISAGIGYRIF